MRANNVSDKYVMMALDMYEGGEHQMEGQEKGETYM